MQGVEPEVGPSDPFHGSLFRDVHFHGRLFVFVSTSELLGSQGKVDEPSPLLICYRFLSEFFIFLLMFKRREKISYFVPEFSVQLILVDYVLKLSTYFLV